MDMTGDRVSETLRKILFFGFPALIALSTVLATAALYFPAPQADYWDHINWLRALQNAPLTLKDLFRQANEHRIAVPRLIFLADDGFFSSTGWFCIGVILASAAAMSALFVGIARRELTGEDARFVGFLAVSFGLLFNQYENFLWENQVQFLFVYLFAVFGAWLAVLESEQATPRPARLATAGLLTLAAAYSMANGVLIYIALAVAFIMLRRFRHAAGWAAFGGLVLVSYLYGYARPGYHPDPTGAMLSKLGLVLTHFQVTMTGLFAGAGVPAAGPGGSALVGGAVAYLLLRMGRIALGRHEAKPGEILFIIVAMYVLGSCLITSAGRAEIDVMQGIASRYQTPVNLFWLSIFALATYDPFFARSPGRKVVVPAVAVCLAILLAGTQWLGWRRAAVRALELGVATDALVVGVPDKQVLTALFPVADVPLAFSDVLIKERRSLFADDRLDMLKEARTSTGGVSPTALGADNLTVTAISEGAYSGLLLKARLNGAAGSSMGRRVTVTDACDRVVGFGRLAAAASRQESKTRLAFKSKPGYLTAYILPPEKTVACPQSAGDPSHDYRLRVGRGL
jgi:hypothetical protein